LRLYRIDPDSHRFSRPNWGSNKWPVIQAKVDSSWLDGGWIWNCPTAEVAYTYNFEGQTYSAIDSKPFLIETTVKERVER